MDYLLWGKKKIEYWSSSFNKCLLWPLPRLL